MATKNCLYSPTIPGIATGIPGHTDLKNVKGLCAPPQNEVGKQLEQLFGKILNGGIHLKRDPNFGDLYVIRSDLTFANGPSYLRFIQWNAMTDVLRVNIVISDVRDERQLRAAQTAEQTVRHIPVVKALATKNAQDAPTLLKMQLEKHGSGAYTPEQWLRLSKRRVLEEIITLQKQTIPSLEKQLKEARQAVRGRLFSPKFAVFVSI